VNTLQKKVNIISTKKKKNVFIKVWDRSLRIVPSFIGFKFKIYQGFKFINVLITDEMVGHRLGEFAPTRVRHEYKKKRSKGKK
jgi:small subunit ribosomal protein S19